MYVCAQLLISYVHVCMCSVIYKLCIYVLSLLCMYAISYVCVCSFIYKLCMYVLSYL